MENIEKIPRKIPRKLHKLHNDNCIDMCYECFLGVLACAFLFLHMFPSIDPLLTRSCWMRFMPTAVTEAQVVESHTDSNFLSSLRGLSRHSSRRDRNVKTTFEAHTIKFSIGAEEVVATYRSNDRKRAVGEVIRVKYAVWLPTLVVPENEYEGAIPLFILFLITELFSLCMGIACFIYCIRYAREYRQWGFVIKNGEAIPAVVVDKSEEVAPLSDDRLKYVYYIKDFSYKVGEETRYMSYKIVTTENAILHNYKHEIYLRYGSSMDILKWYYWGKAPASPKDRLFFDEEEAWVFYHPKCPKCPILYIKDMEDYL